MEISLVEVTAAQVGIAVDRNCPGTLGNGPKIRASVEAECCWVEPAIAPRAKGRDSLFNESLRDAGAGC